MHLQQWKFKLNGFCPICLCVGSRVLVRKRLFLLKIFYLWISCSFVVWSSNEFPCIEQVVILCRANSVAIINGIVSATVPFSFIISTNIQFSFTTWIYTVRCFPLLSLTKSPSRVASMLDSIELLENSDIMVSAIQCLARKNMLTANKLIRTAVQK